MRSWIAPLLLPPLPLKLGGRESRTGGCVQACVCVCLCLQPMLQTSLVIPLNLFIGSVQFVYEPSHLQNNRQ